MRDKQPAWALGPFVKDALSVFETNDDQSFDCPVLGRPVRWEVSNVYNLAMITRDGLLHMVYHADDEPLDLADAFGNPVVISRMGHAVSWDGIRFTRDRDPYSIRTTTPAGVRMVMGLPGPAHSRGRGRPVFHGQHRLDRALRPQRPVIGEAVSEAWEDLLMTAATDDLVHWTKHGPARYRPF